MGAGITIAQGINRVEPDTANFAFIGDSTFFHTGIPGVVNAVYNGAEIIVAVLDNSITAMTGGQPHPGVGRSISGAPARRVSIFDVLSAIGVDDIQRVNPFDLPSAKAAVTRALAGRGVRAILFEGECAAVSRRHGDRCRVDVELCVGCSVCVKKLGCPALSIQERLAVIDQSSCTGCGLCREVCPVRAITGGEEK
jgi:indolepyruvate ferredoxin oxidoreductase alpha subunit